MEKRDAAREIDIRKWITVSNQESWVSELLHDERKNVQGVENFLGVDFLWNWKTFWIIFEKFIKIIKIVKFKIVGKISRKKRFKFLKKSLKNHQGWNPLN